MNFISHGKGEAYVYNPYFHQFSNGEKFIVVEEGYEYMSGLDIYHLHNQKMIFLGYVPVAAPDNELITDHISFYRSNTEYKIKFKDSIEYKAGEQNFINGAQLSVSIKNDSLSIELNQ